MPWAVNEMTLGPLKQEKAGRDARQKGMIGLHTKASSHLIPLLQRNGHHVLEQRLAGLDKDLPCAWMEKVLEGVHG